MDKIYSKFQMSFHNFPHVLQSSFWKKGPVVQRVRLKRKEKSYIVLGFSSKTRPPREAGNEEKIRKGPWEAIKKELKRQKDSRKAFSDFFKVWSRKKYKIQKILQKTLKATLK